MSGSLSLAWCSGCGARWEPTGYVVNGVVNLCGDCWRRVQQCVHATPEPSPERLPIEVIRQRCADFREGYRAGYARGESGEASDIEDAWDRSKASAEMAEMADIPEPSPVKSVTVAEPVDLMKALKKSLEAHLGRSPQSEKEPKP